MTKTVVHFLRHGEVHNPDGILYGRLPGFKLSDTGTKQALTVAEYLSANDVAYVVASPLQRAQETAAPIAAAHRLDVDTDEQLIESANQFEGMKVAVGDGVLKHPRHWAKLRNPLRPSWGEPYLDVARRMLGAAFRARAAAEGHEAVCISHQLPIWTLRRMMEAKRLWHDPRKRECGLASLTSLVFEGETVTEVRYAEPAGHTDPRVHGA